MQINQNQMHKLALPAVSLACLVSLLVFVVGVQDQLQFGSSRCLLFVNDYHPIPNGPYVFTATSGACGAAIAIGWIAWLFVVAATALLVYYDRRQQQPQKSLLRILLLSSAIMVVLMLIVSSIVSAGLAQTCHEFEHNVQNSTCGKIFSDGFFQGESAGPPKNINTANAAQGAGWVAVLLLGVITAGIYSLWKQTGQWWTGI